VRAGRSGRGWMCCPAGCHYVDCLDGCRGIREPPVDGSVPRARCAVDRSGAVVPTLALAGCGSSAKTAAKVKPLSTTTAAKTTTTKAKVRPKPKPTVAPTVRPAATTPPTPAPTPPPTPPPTAAPTQPAPNCTPGYDPCLPSMSDYDSAGGSGQRPWLHRPRHSDGA
jgi:hypothetical protein